MKIRDIDELSSEFLGEESEILSEFSELSEEEERQVVGGVSVRVGSGGFVSVKGGAADEDLKITNFGLDYSELID